MHKALYMIHHYYGYSRKVNSETGSCVLLSSYLPSVIWSILLNCCFIHQIHQFLYLVHSSLLFSLSVWWKTITIIQSSLKQERIFSIEISLTSFIIFCILLFLWDWLALSLLQSFASWVLGLHPWPLAPCLIYCLYTFTEQLMKH